jgi:small redox-active disulfide protein 1
MKLLVFVSPSCVHCPKAEKVVKEVVPEYADKGVSWEKLRVKTSEGKALSRKYGVKGVPTIIIPDENGNELERIVGAPSDSKLRSVIEKHLGIKKSFFSKLLGK